MNLKTTRLKHWLLPCLILSSLVTKAQQPFGAGNLAVYRVGTGTALPTSAANAVFIDEYTPSGTLVQSIAMPTTSATGVRALTESGTATSDGLLQLSPNGKYLAIPGYDASVGTASIASSSATTINRIVGVMNSQAAYSLTAYTVGGSNNFRSAVTTDSLNIWMGTGGGVYYSTSGVAAGTQLASTNVRAVNIFNGQLYASSGSSSFRMTSVGTGLPTTTGQTATNLPGTPATGSPYGYYIANLTNGNTVLYVADDGGTGGILKYSLVSGSWVANGTIGTGSDGYRGITGVTNNDTVTLYATTASSTSPYPSKLMSLVDKSGYNTTMSSGTNATLTTLVTATTNTIFRGVAFAPQCPAPTITNAPTAQSICVGGNATFTVTASGSSLGYQWMKDGIAIPGASTNAYAVTGATAADAGNYSVAVTACSSVTTTPVALTVNTAPTATITAAGNTAICAGSSVVLNANTGTGLTYQWSNGTNITGATNAAYTATAAGSYTVTVSNGSCSATSTATAVTVNPAPAATITAAGATNLCAGGSVVLNANTGTGLTYQWSNGGTAITGATTAAYTATAAGSYTVTVSNGTCTATSAATTVNILSGAGATITPAGNASFCAGGAVVLNANTGTGLTYQWSNGTNITGATNASYTATAAGSYTVTVSNGTCSATSAATTVTVNPLPTATVTAATTTTFCAGGSVVLNANTGTGLTYQWSNGTNIAGATNASYTATAAGSYTVTVSNGTCAATSAATTVTVNAVPTATITAAGPTAFCFAGSVTLNANTGTGLTYQWMHGINSVPGATAAAYTATAPGDYTVVVSNGTCIDTSVAITVTVHTIPEPVVTAGGATTFCAGDSVVLHTITGAGFMYQWKSGWNNIPGATAVSYTATTTGAYSVTVTDSFCAVVDTAVNVTVNPLPTATITATGMTLSVGTFSSYQWYLNNQAITGATSQTYTAAQNGSYFVKVTNSNGCTNNSDTVNLSSTGVENVNGKNGVTIYPNPAQDVVNIDAPMAVNVTIRNINGQVVFTENNAHHADISKLANGLYLILVTDQKGQLLLTEKLLKN